MLQRRHLFPPPQDETWSVLQHSSGKLPEWERETERDRDIQNDLHLYIYMDTGNVVIYHFCFEPSYPGFVLLLYQTQFIRLLSSLFQAIVFFVHKQAIFRTNCLCYVFKTPDYWSCHLKVNSKVFCVKLTSLECVKAWGTHLEL